MSHFAQRYEAKLAELTFNSKPIINGLTIIADENKNVHAQDVVNCITARIGQLSLFSQRQPLLYLLDSIVKNVGEPYKTLFDPSLASVYVSTYTLASATERASMVRLLATWEKPVTLFSASTLAEIHSRCNIPPTLAAPVPSQPPPSSSLSHPLSAIPPAHHHPHHEHRGPPATYPAGLLPATSTSSAAPYAYPPGHHTYPPNLPPPPQVAPHYSTPHQPYPQYHQYPPPAQSAPQHYPPPHGYSSYPPSSAPPPPSSSAAPVPSPAPGAGYASYYPSGPYAPPHAHAHAHPGHPSSVPGPAGADPRRQDPKRYRAMNPDGSLADHAAAAHHASNPIVSLPPTSATASSSSSTPPRKSPQDLDRLLAGVEAQLVADPDLQRTVRHLRGRAAAGEDIEQDVIALWDRIKVFTTSTSPSFSATSPPRSLRELSSLVTSFAAPSVIDLGDADTGAAHSPLPPHHHQQHTAAAAASSSAHSPHSPALFNSFAALISSLAGSLDDGTDPAGGAGGRGSGSRKHVIIADGKSTPAPASASLSSSSSSVPASLLPSSVAPASSEPEDPPNFSSAALKERRPKAILALYNPEDFQCKTCGRRFATLKLLDAHLDFHFKMNSRAARAKTATSTQWMGTEEDWIQSNDIIFGDELKTTFFDMDKSNKRKAEEKIPSHLVDEGQPNCFVCHEAFEKTWDDEEGAWVYIDCVELEDEQPHHEFVAAGGKPGMLLHYRCHNVVVPTENGAKTADADDEASPSSSSKGKLYDDDDDTFPPLEQVV